MKNVTKIRGTQDKFGSSYRLEEAVRKKVVSWLQNYNYSRVETPVMEKVELFIDSLGADTDIVNKELFYIQTPDDEKICLRPEFTVGIFRAFLEAKSSIILPWKVFAVGPCFRYERPQKGRWRQFDQVSIELMGGKSILYDVELIMMLDKLFSQQLGIVEYSLKINCIGLPEERVVFRKELAVFLDKFSTELCLDCQKRRSSNILRCLDCKNESCQNTYRAAPTIFDYLSAQTLQEFELLKDTLMCNGVNFEVCPTLVRGLDYYEGVVFEFISNSLGAQSTFCGGGRYELSKKFDLPASERTPSVGAGIGLGRLCMILENIGFQFDTPQLLCVVPVSDAEQGFCLMLADFLRVHGFRVDVNFDKTSIKNGMKQADKLAATKVIIVGEQEVATGLLTLKDMKTGVEEKVYQKDLLEVLKN